MPTTSCFVYFRQLLPGHSGSIVYLKKLEGGIERHFPLAMVCGEGEPKEEYKCVYYRALFLSSSRDDIESAYTDVSHLRPYSCSNNCVPVSAVSNFGSSGTTVPYSSQKK